MALVTDFTILVMLLKALSYSNSLVTHGLSVERWSEETRFRFHSSRRLGLFHRIL